MVELVNPNALYLYSGGQSANIRGRFKNCRLVPSFEQIIGSSETTNPTTDNSNVHEFLLTALVMFVWRLGSFSLQGQQKIFSLGDQRQSDLGG